MKQLTKAQKKMVNQNIQDAGIKGLFEDNYWAPVRRIEMNLQALATTSGWQYQTEETRYIQDEEGCPIRKEWLFSVSTPEGRKSYGVIFAAGAGTNQDPLSKYDISAYMI